MTGPPFTGEYLTLHPPRRLAFTHHTRTAADRISDETVTVTFRELEPGRTEMTLVNSRRGPALADSAYAPLREGWQEWLTLLEKSLLERSL